jgi:hypothetical protein
MTLRRKLEIEPNFISWSSAYSYGILEQLDQHHHLHYTLPFSKQTDCHYPYLSEKLHSYPLHSLYILYDLIWYYKCKTNNITVNLLTFAYKEEKKQSKIMPRSIMYLIRLVVPFKLSNMFQIDLNFEMQTTNDILVHKFK